MCAGQSRVLVLRGEAGIGKSALLQYLLEGASGCRTARTAGVESEMALAFAGLHHLCAPFLDRLDRLSEPQREALGKVFGQSAGAPPDRFLVGLVVLGLLSDVAHDRPLVCVIDDAQWQDRAAAQCLGFVARRLLAESVAFVFAVREPSDAPDLTGLSELMIRGLDDADARALLDSATPGRLDESIRDRMVLETRGNPLALLELPRGMTAAELAGGFGLPAIVPLSTRIEHETFSRIGALAFAERAGRELAATGETVPRRTAETRDYLTAQEAQIARMAADGHTNPEIGTQLFISPRTVEYHLRKVFTKLDISSRRELRGALPEDQPALAPS
jgi:DNA-binding CsgD family transcriptional regulator